MGQKTPQIRRSNSLVAGDRFPLAGGKVIPNMKKMEIKGFSVRKRTRGTAKSVSRPLLFISAKGHDEKRRIKRKTREIMFDSAIMAGLNFFTILASLGVVGLLQDPAQGIGAALISAGLAFFLYLAIQRGLVPNSPSRQDS